MSQSVVIYWPDGEPTPEQWSALCRHFKLQGVAYLDARKITVNPTGELIFTPKHAHRAAQAAGALYMGREFALKKAGLLK